MPPRYTYWTIIVGNLPTAFRTARREELLPTFAQLRAKHPDAVMKWFARGRLWDSPEQARDAWAARPAPGDRRRAGTTEKRGPEWRPGGAHRDPRQQFKGGRKRQEAGGRRREAEGRKPGAGGRRPPPGTDRPPRPGEEPSPVRPVSPDVIEPRHPPQRGRR